MRRIVEHGGVHGIEFNVTLATEQIQKHRKTLSSTFSSF